LFTCRDITEYKRMEEQLSRNIRHRKKIARDLALFFDLSADLFSITDGRSLKKVNPAWSTVLGYTEKELAGNPVSWLVHPDDMELTSSLEKRLKAGSVVRFQNRYRHKDGSYRWISWISTMSDEGQIHAVGRDITADKKEEDEIKRRLLKFKLQAGRTYLVKELSPVKLTEAFRELLGIHHAGIMISRREWELLNIGVEKDFRYLWLSDRGGKGTLQPDIESIEAFIEGLPGEQVIAIDSLDYLVHKCGFKAVLSMVGHLREIAFFGNHIVILGADDSCISGKESKMLDKEVLHMEINPRSDVPEDLLEVLRKVHEYNAQGVRPTRTQLCRALGLSHPTVRKRLLDLKARELISEARPGRSAKVEVTDRGRIALNR
jgi:PAS domain S-box-containing protein